MLVHTVRCNGVLETKGHHIRGAILHGQDGVVYQRRASGWVISDGYRPPTFQLTAATRSLRESYRGGVGPEG